MLASKQPVGMRVSLQPRRSAVALVSRPALVVPGLPSRRPLTIAASTMAPSPNQSGSGEERSQSFPASMGVPSAALGPVTMRGGGDMGSGGSLGATMERSRMNFVMPTPVVKGPKLDDGGDGGDIGKINRNGGGGDGGGGDDDDWFNEDEDGDGDGEGEGKRGTGFFRDAIPESYDKFSIGAVFAEWMKTVQDLPAILRQAVQMGLFSSAQLVRFFCMDVRPGVTRTISRHLPPSAARDFVGRLMADPGFLQKMVLETAFASCASLWYEFRARGDRFKNELDLVLINTLGMAAATGATVWLLAPSRSYGSLAKMPWQQMLEGLPNCVFDVSGPLRAYTKQARAAGFLAKAAELSAVGALTGTATSLLAAAAVAVRRRSEPEWQPSVPVPEVGRSSGGLAAFFALNANVRYQLIGGMDRFLFDRTTFLWTYVAMSGATRLASNQVGELSRAWWQGLPAPSTLSTPAFLAAPALPITRKVKKKVSKRVPRSVLQQRQQQQQQAQAAAATMAAAAVVLPGAEQAQAALVSLKQQQQQQQPEALQVLRVSEEAESSEQPAVEAHVQAAVAAPAEQLPVQALTAAMAQPQQQRQQQQQAALQQQQSSEQEEDDDEEGGSSEGGSGSEEPARAAAPPRRGAYAVRH